MTEILYNAIKAVAGEDINILAEITDVNNNNITSGCSMVFLGKDHSIIGEYDGTYKNGEWTFNIPAAVTTDLKGRYWYSIKFDGGALSFAAPIYMGV